MPARNLDLSAAATADMGDIWRYTAERWSEERADGYYQGIADALADLAAATPSASLST